MSLESRGLRLRAALLGGAALLRGAALLGAARGLGWSGSGLVVLLRGAAVLGVALVLFGVGLTLMMMLRGRRRDAGENQCNRGDGDCRTGNNIRLHQHLPKVR